MPSSPGNSVPLSLPPSIWEDDWFPPVPAPGTNMYLGFGDLAVRVFHAASEGSHHPMLRITGSSVREVASELICKVRSAAEREDYSSVLVPQRSFTMQVLHRYQFCHRLT